MNIKKKALEPIVATILLVVVAVILVVIVLAWGKNFAGDSLNQVNNQVNTGCIGATIAISDCDWDKDNNKTTFLIKNTSDSYAFGANDFTCGVLDSTNIGNSNLNGTINLASELGPGQQKVLACENTVLNANKVTLKVWSQSCPNDATAELKNC